MLFDLQREGLANQLRIPRLDRDQCEEMLGNMFAEEITPEFLEGIYGETEGNPFYIEEVCKALVESGELFYRDGRWHRPSMEELGIPIHPLQFCQCPGQPCGTPCTDPQFIGAWAMILVCCSCCWSLRYSNGDPGVGILGLFFFFS